MELFVRPQWSPAVASGPALRRRGTSWPLASSIGP
jgi:hypothetical protein